MSKDHIKRFLDQIKTEGRSSPAGMHWQKFHDLLGKHQKNGQGDPPRPLILAAASESDTSKHARLASQLNWALNNDCLEEALALLETLSPENWNQSSKEQWGKNGY